MSKTRGAYKRRNTQKLTREQLRAAELTATRRLSDSVKVKVRHFFERRGIENSGQALRPEWDEQALEATSKRYIRHESTPPPGRMDSPVSLMYGTAAFALRVEEELRIAKAAGKVKEPQAGSCDDLRGTEGQESCEIYPH